MYNKLDVKFSKLNFKPDYFFGLGSPLGAVLTFRGQNPTLYHPEHDIQFENIFHPFDPLGYRFEPLLNDYFTDKPAVLIDRSIPIGPSFSFPSFPISASLFSFFSWKQEDKAAGAMYEATSDAAKNQEEQPRDVQEQIPSTNGFISSLLQYFSKGTKKEGAKPEEKCWEELDTREQLLALREDLDRTLTSADELLLAQNNGSSMPRPMIQPRSKTYSPPYTDDQKLEDTETKRMQLRKTMTDQHSPSNCHHLIEVLGIDGLPRLERTKGYVDHGHEQEDKDEEKEGHTDEQTPDKESTASTKGGGDDIWSDLNAELHKPGPAITEPGESKEDIAQDSTVPNASANDKDKVTDVEEEERNEKSKLPGGRRIDYVLQPESMMAMLANEYLIGLRAHFSYWTNKDFIWHMLRRIENLNDKMPSVSTSSSTPSNTSNSSKE
ncbi:hypothetical protein BCV71DRAFT_244426 [Rhizopus microsporus]|uniref:DDHD domain-containing protein n=1 Tax=Rhizopus microsporus TaxID=58291 RepID=A0A1X0RXN6_RHIZD|nr:hypothetical protein BCV71DRAFT_244426 [Rhizopus microsporus]